MTSKSKDELETRRNKKDTAEGEDTQNPKLVKLVSDVNKISFNIEHILSEAPFESGVSELKNVKNAIPNKIYSQSPGVFKSVKYENVESSTNRKEFNGLSSPTIFPFGSNDVQEETTSKNIKSEPNSSTTQNGCSCIPSVEDKSNLYTISDNMIKESKPFDTKETLIKGESCFGRLDVPSSSLEHILTSNMVNVKSLDLAPAFNNDSLDSQSRDKSLNSSSFFSDLFALSTAVKSYSQNNSIAFNSQETASCTDETLPKQCQLQHSQALLPRFIPNLGCYPSSPSYFFPFPATFSSFFPQNCQPKILMKANQERWKHLATATFPSSSVVHLPIDGAMTCSNPISTTGIPKKRKMRTVFSDTQLRGLESTFKSSQYLAMEQRANLANSLNLSENQVKTWFQNRRMKEKKNTMNNAASSLQAYTLGQIGSSGTFSSANMNTNTNVQHMLSTGRKMHKCNQ